MTFTLTVSAQKILSLLTTADRWMGDAIAKALDRENQRSVGVIQRDYLTGPRPEKLGVVTNRLRNSIRASNAVNDWPLVGAAIGTNVEYAAIHEFGGTIKRVTKAGVVRLRETAPGKLFMRGNLATFARKEHKRVREVAFEGGKAYEIKMPARPFIRPGILDRTDDYSRAISNAVVSAWNGRS